MTKERNPYLDILKAITIILVVIGHAIQYGSGLEYLTYGGFLYNKVFIFIYSFHMPLFMLISGYLFAVSSKEKTFKELLKSKLKQLLIPLGCWSVITLIVECVKIPLGVSTHTFGFVWIFQTLLAGFIGGPWFLWALWWCSLIIIIGKKVFKDNPIPYFIICLLSFILPDKNNIAVYSFMWPFFLIAYLFKKYDFESKLNKIYTHKAFGLSVLIIFVLLLRYYNFNSFIYTSGYSVLNKDILMQIHNNVFRFTIGIFGSLSIMCIVNAFMDITPNFIKKTLSYIGTCTLGIYLISNYLFDEILKRIPVPGLNFWYASIEVIVALGICIGLTTLLQKCKITNMLFLGGRQRKKNTE